MIIMKREVILGLIFIFLAFSLVGFSSAYTCPAGQHTLSGGTEASGPAMCIPDIGASGPVSGAGSSSGSSSTSTTTGSSGASTDDGTINPSGSTGNTAQQGIEMDSRVSAKVSELYGTGAYDQAKKLYDDSVAVNWDDYNAVADQVANADYDTADSLQRAYNIRALNRLNDVWTQIAALEAEMRANEPIVNEGDQINEDYISNQNQQGSEASIPQFQSMIDFDFNFQPMTMTLSQSQIAMLGGVPPAKINDLFHSVKTEAIRSNPGLGALGNANLANSPLANRLGNENKDTLSKLQKGVSLNNAAIGNFMNQQVNGLLGI